LTALCRAQASLHVLGVIDSYSRNPRLGRSVRRYPAFPHSDPLPIRRSFCSALLHKLQRSTNTPRQHDIPLVSNSVVSIAPSSERTSHMAPAEEHGASQSTSAAASSALGDCVSIPPEPIPDNDSQADDRDPFGIRGVTADADTIRRAEGAMLRRKGWGPLARRCPNCGWLFTAADKVLRLLSAKPKVIGWNSEENRFVATQKEEGGVRRAAGMTMSWTRPELIACYVLSAPSPHPESH